MCFYAYEILNFSMVNKFGIFEMYGWCSDMLLVRMHALAFRTEVLILPKKLSISVHP